MDNLELICGGVYKVVLKPGVSNILNESTTWYMKFSYIDNCGFICDSGCLAFDERDENIVDYISYYPGPFTRIDEIESITKIDNPLILETFEHILNKYGWDDFNGLIYWDEELNVVKNSNKK